jgi:hypothetical protein
MIGLKTLLSDGAAGLLAAACLATHAQNAQHLSITQPGGMPGLPVVTGVERAGNGVSITWDGPSGYYQLFQKESLTNSKWQAVGQATNLLRQAIVNTNLPSAFFRVSGPPPQYAGRQTCAECHAPILTTLAQTAHPGAFTNAPFAARGGQTNAACLPCHTVGSGLQTGFISLAKTPKLAGVQCENCHGPAANHAANPDDPTLVPRAEVAATVCGGCHAVRFAEWKTSEHTGVISNLNASAQIDHCGRCHSGTARLSLIQGQAPLAGDAGLGIQCAVCHDPHQTNGYPAQLRYPLASTNDDFMPTNGVFANFYNARINVCGQCHNDAGASWTNSAGPPHSSSQYNMLLGTVGELETPGPHYQPASHALLLANQCVDCHMQTVTNVTALYTNTGHSHTFALNSPGSYEMCGQCHGINPQNPESFKNFAQEAVSNRVQELKFDLDYWATNKAPAALFAKYGNRAWEYTSPGPLSPGGPGPAAAEQALISTNIQKARFNVYVVLSDGSLGIHNPYYIEDLLDAAENWIYEELYP